MTMMTFDEAFRDFYQAIVGYTNSKLLSEDTCAEDLANECFVLLHLKWNELQSHEPIVIRVWLFRVARNRIMDYKKKKRLQTISIDDDAGRERLEMELHRLTGDFDEMEEIQRYLNKKGLKTHNDRNFTSSYILRIMKNEIYRGFLSKGGVKSERLENLQIIPDKVFFQVQNILEQRNVKNDEKRQIALTNRGKALLSGNIYCGHCGSRLATSRGFIRYTRADGSQRSDSRGRYVCYHRSRGLCTSPLKTDN